MDVPTVKERGHRLTDVVAEEGRIQDRDVKPSDNELKTYKRN